jgi:hypothetical protein
MNQQHPRTRRESGRSTSQSEKELRPIEEPMEEMMALLRKYARQRPEMTALACFGIGFVLGWRLRPW